MLGAGHGGATPALGHETRMLLSSMMETTCSHPSNTRYVTPAPAAASSGDERPLLHGQSAVMSGEVQWVVVGRHAVLEVVEGGVRILEACRGAWVSGEKVCAAGQSQRAGEGGCGVSEQTTDTRVGDEQVILSWNHKINRRERCWMVES